MKIDLSFDKDRLFKMGYVLGMVAAAFQFISSAGYYALSFFPEHTVNLNPYWTIGGARTILFLAPTTAFNRGIAYIFLIHFGLKTRQKWCWYFLILLGLVTPLQNLITQIHLKLFPSGFFQLMLIFPAVLLMGPYVFSGKDNKLI